MATLGNPTNTIAVLQKYQFQFQKKYHLILYLPYLLLPL